MKHSKCNWLKWNKNEKNILLDFSNVYLNEIKAVSPNRMSIKLFPLEICAQIWFIFYFACLISNTTTYIQNHRFNVFLCCSFFHFCIWIENCLLFLILLIPYIYVYSEIVSFINLQRILISKIDFSAVEWN